MNQPMPQEQHLPPEQLPPHPEPPAVEEQGWQVPAPLVPLILSHYPMSMAPRAAVEPGRALMYSDDRGEPVRLTKPPGRWSSRRYHWRFEVDLSDHYVSFVLAVPSMSQAAKFRLTVDVGWRVTDPAQIVRSRIGDGNAIVRSRIVEAVSPICRTYTIENDGPLEENLARSLGNGREHHFSKEGITVFRFSAQVDHDVRAAERIADRVDAKHQAKLTTEGIADLRQQITTEDDLIWLLMQRHPDRVDEVIGDIRKRREMSVQSRIELFNKLVDKDLIQASEMDTIRQLILQPIEGIVSAVPAGAFGIEHMAPSERKAIDRPRAADQEDEEDVMPSQIIEGSVDGVSDWRPLPWQTGRDGEKP